MPIVSLPDWNQFLAAHPSAHLLQTGAWGQLKSAFGWRPVRIVNGEQGVQILFRQLPLGFTIGYIPKMAVDVELPSFSQELWREIDVVCKHSRAIFLKLELDLWQNTNRLPFANDRFQVSPHNIQPPRTIIVNIKESEEE